MGWVSMMAMKRDVLTMLNVELRQARAGNWELYPGPDGVDVDFVEMLVETIAEIKQLRDALRHIEVCYGTRDFSKVGQIARSALE